MHIDIWEYEVLETMETLPWLPQPGAIDRGVDRSAERTRARGSGSLKESPTRAAPCPSTPGVDDTSSSNGQCSSITNSM